MWLGAAQQPRGVVVRQPELVQAVSGEAKDYVRVQPDPGQGDDAGDDRRDVLPLRPNAIRPRASCETPVRLPISVKKPKISAPAACPTTMITID